jgi:hypothetical protein
MSWSEILDGLDRVISEAAREDRPGLVVALSARLAALGAAMVAWPGPIDGHGGKAAPEPAGRLLTAQEAAVLAGVTVRWLRRHTRGLRFRRDLSRKAARFEEHGFRRWLQARG